MALIPDVADMCGNELWRACNHTLDMDVQTKPGPTLSFGLVPTMPHLHSLFRHIPGQRAIVGPGTVRHAYYMLLQNDVPARQMHRPVVSFLWERFGHQALLDGHAAQQFTFSDWREKTWRTFADERWFEVERNGVPCGRAQERDLRHDP